MAKKATHYLRSLTIDPRDWKTQYRAGCGKRLTKTEKYQVGNYSGRKRTWIAERVPTPNGVTCAACLRWLALSVADREASDIAASAKAEAAHLAINEKRKADKKISDAERDAHVESMRPSALVAMDVVLSERDLDRDPACASLLAEAIATAMVAYKAENPRSRGERRWVFETGWATAFPDHPSDHTANGRAVVCRFCRVALGVGEIGYDYSTTCFDARGSVVHWPSPENRATIRVSVARHTMLCALAYLAGVANPEALADSRVVEDAAPGVDALGFADNSDNFEED